jgi:hypothetical protein
VCCAYYLFNNTDFSCNFSISQNKSYALKIYFYIWGKFEGKGNAMNPDYAAMVSDFIRPVVTFFLFAFMVLGWAVAYQLMKEVTELKIKLGRETQQEGLKDWFLRKSATIVLPIYSFKTFVVEIQYKSILKRFLKKRKKVLQLIFE